MNVSTEDLSDTRKKVTVALTGDEIQQEEKTVLRDFMREAKIPGFRPGKAPENLIRRRHKEGINEELKRRVMNKAFKSLEDEDLKIYSIVDVDEPALEPGTDAEIVVTVDIVPDFPLPEYEGLEVTVPPAEVSDEDVEKAIEEVRRQRSEFNVVEREAQKGDYVKVSYKGTIDDKPIAEIVEDPKLQIWGTQENTWEEAGVEGENRFGVPVVIDGILGMKADDKKTEEMTFPEDHEVEALQGKTAQYEMEVHEVRERVMPELNEEFLKSLQVESEEDLRNRIRDDLKSRKEREAAMSKRRQVVEHLVAQTDFPLPESGIENETQQVMAQAMQENMQRGVSQDELEENKEALYANSRQMAERNVRLSLIMDEIAQKEEVDVTEQDFQQVIMNQAMQTRTRPEEIVKELKDDRRRIQQLRRRILIDKALELVAEKANVTVSPEAADESGQEPAEHSH